MHDRFHISAHLNDAVPAVHREENRRLQKLGDERLKGTQRLFGFDPDNLKEEEPMPADVAPNREQRNAWILNLPEPIDIDGSDFGGDPSESYKGIKGIHILVYRDQLSLSPDEFDKTEVSVSGQLFPRNTANHARPVIILVSQIRRSKAELSPPKALASNCEFTPAGDFESAPLPENVHATVVADPVNRRNHAALLPGNVSLPLHILPTTNSVCVRFRVLDRNKIPLRFGSAVLVRVRLYSTEGNSQIVQIEVQRSPKWQQKNIRFNNIATSATPSNSSC